MMACLALCSTRSAADESTSGAIPKTAAAKLAATTRRPRTNVTINDLHFLDNGRVVSAHWDGAVRLWRNGKAAGDWKLEKIVVAHDDNIKGLAISPDRAWLASAGKDGVVAVWDQELNQVARSSQFSEGVNDLIFACNRQRIGKPQTLLVSHYGGTIRSLSVESLLRIRAPIKARLTAKRLACAPAQAWVASVDWNGWLAIWDPQRAKQITKIAHPVQSPLNALAVSPDGMRLVSGDHQGRLVQWSTHSWAIDWQLQAHTARVKNAAFSDDGKWLASVALDGLVHITDTTAGIRHWQKKISHRPLYAVAFSPDGKFLALGGREPEIFFAARHDEQWFALPAIRIPRITRAQMSSSNSLLNK